MEIILVLVLIISGTILIPFAYDYIKRKIWKSSTK